MKPRHCISLSLSDLEIWIFQSFVVQIFKTKIGQKVAEKGETVFVHLQQNLIFKQTNVACGRKVREAEFKVTTHSQSCFHISLLMLKFPYDTSTFRYE